MTKCNYCGYIDEVEPKGYIRSFCDSCVKDKEVGICGFTAKDTIHVRSYGNVSVKRIDEVTRRRILPIQPTNGTSYYVGRMGENGKIAEKEPNY